jgi:pimeloyl-ACP methyl ester carboxylesterase
MAILPVDDFVHANGLRLHYRRWSPSTPAPDQSLSPIVLLHGLASAARIWDFVAPLLAGRGYVVTAFDQRGHGESDKPDGDYGFATIIADDFAAFQSLGIVRPMLVGHSWGAMVALEYAATYPDSVSALALVDGAVSQLSARPGWSREQAIKDLAPPRFAGTPRETFLGYFRSGPLGQQWTPELEDSVLHIVQLREDDTVAPRLEFANHLQIIGAMWDQPLYDLYRQLRCPVTLIIAEQQPTDERQENFFRQRLEGLTRIEEANPTIRIVRLENTIHDIPLQRPERLVEEILSYPSSSS